ncbi:hypothetical protein [Rhodococcus ruber]|uniref:hypothetical protein n=1 Tax=Rhodococcus ruber TaxID=1830 RepID=UPI001D190B1E|nr:hypothetical protein [Rhodococcus ruber]
MDPYTNTRSGVYRADGGVAGAAGVPDEEFNEIFARLPSHRDRALVAFYVSTGARASELSLGHPRQGRSGTSTDHRWCARELARASGSPRLQ